jgi:hypothetical protein
MRTDVRGWKLQVEGWDEKVGGCGGWKWDEKVGGARKQDGNRGVRNEDRIGVHRTSIFDPRSSILD